MYQVTISKPHGILITLWADDAGGRAFGRFAPAKVYALLKAVEALDSGNDARNGATEKLLATGTKECACALRHTVGHSPDAGTKHTIGLSESAGSHHAHIASTSVKDALLHGIHIYIAGFLCHLMFNV